MRFNRKTAVVAAAATAILLAALFFGLPPLARHLAVQKLQEATGRTARIERISFNPFTLRAGIYGFRLSEKGSAKSFVSFSSAQVALSPLSLPKRAFIVKEITISSPYLHPVRIAPNSYNFSDLLVSKEKPKQKEGSYLFSLNNIVLKNGSIDFEDRALHPAKEHAIRRMAISIPFFSNIPYLADRYVTPHFSAQVNGTPVAFEGKLKPLTRTVEAVLDLKVQALDIPFYLGYLPFPPPVRVDSGKLTTTLELGYRVDARTGPDATLRGSVVLDGLAVRDPAGAPLGQLRRGELNINRAGLLSREFDIDSLKLDRSELYASRDPEGKWNFQKLVSPGSTQQPEKETKRPAAVRNQEPEAGARKPAVKVARLTLSASTVHLSDAVPKGGFKTEVKEIDLSATGLSTAPGAKAPFSFSLATARGERLSLKGDFVPAPLALDAELALTGIPLRDYYPYLSDTLAAPVTGTLGVVSRLLYSDATGLVLEKTSLKGENLAAPFAKGEGVRLKEALVNDISFRMKENLARVGSVDLKGGNVTLAREEGGNLSALRLLKSRPETPPQARRRAKPTGGKEQAAPFSYRLAKVNGSDLALRFTDRTREDAPTFSLSRLKFSLSGIAGPKQGPIPFTVNSGYGAKGRIAAAGTVTPSPLRLKGNLELSRIALRDFDSYLPEGTEIFLADGALDTRLALNIEQAASELKGSFAGRVAVHSFYCQDTVYDEDLLKWDSLELEELKGTLAPFSLAIKDVSLSNFYARVIVEPDGSLNLQHLVRREPEASAPAAPPPAGKATPPSATVKRPEPAPTPAGASTAQPHPVRIETVTMQGGTLNFSDRHLKSPFDTTFFNLGGRVSGLTSEANRAADVDLRGNLENHSPLSITGVINPLRGDLFLDLKIAFTDIDLTPFTPYANTYLGYSVDRGKLNLDLTYKIDKKALTSQNKLFIDQFTFGKQVASEKATKLPVRLAVALLKDRKGEIHLDLPVVGQTDDPKFNIGRIILQVLKNLLVKAATSPFALIGSLFGGGEDFSAVTFLPGSTQLGKPEEAKLLKLSQALNDRPALSLEISGFVDRERDVEGYKQELLLKKLKTEKFRAQVKEGTLQKGQTPEEMELTPKESSLYLKAVYAKEKFPKPRNVLGFAKDLPDEEMRKLIIAHTQVGPNELQVLARERAETVRDFLLKTGKLPRERLFEKNADIFRPPGKEGAPASRVEFGAIAK